MAQENEHKFYVTKEGLDELLKEHNASVKVLRSADKWYGVTYKEDKPQVMAAIRALKAQGLSPEKLWEDK